MNNNRIRRCMAAVAIAAGLVTVASPAVAAPATPTTTLGQPTPELPTLGQPTPPAPPTAATPTLGQPTPPAAPTSDAPTLGQPTPPAAPTSGAPEETPTGILGVGGAEMEALSDRYSSLGGALVWYYAGQQGLSVGNYLQQNPTQAASLLGLQNTQQLASLPSDLGMTATGAQDLGVLNNQLTAAGFALDTSSFGSLSEYAAAISAQTGSIDAAVVSAGANWAQQLGTLRTPALNMPAAPGVDKSAATSIPEEGLMFGMFFDKSLTALISDHPDVFSQVQQSGLGTDTAQQAWRTSMQKALAGSQEDFTSMMPSKCGAAMMTSMASGSRTAAASNGITGCGSCVTTGLYMNSQMSRLFNPSATSTLPNSSDTVLSPSEYGNLQDWQKNLIQQQNPNLGTSLQQSMGTNASGNCTTGSAATTGALAVSLPGVFSNLTKK